eukprot:scaffold10856_cov100-Isochrysis_galbana.AAC.1
MSVNGAAFRQVRVACETHTGHEQGGEWHTTVAHLTNGHRRTTAECSPSEVVDGRRKSAPPPTPGNVGRGPTDAATTVAGRRRVKADAPSRRSLAAR